MPRAIPDTLTEHWYARERERHLLGWALLAVALATLMLLGARPKDGLTVALRDLAPVAWYALAFGAAHGLLVVGRFRGEQLLLPLIALLCGLGVLARMRMGLFDPPRGGPLDPWLLPAGVGLMLAVALAGANGRYRALGAAPWYWGFALVSLALPVALLATGERFRGGVYGLGFLTPGEALKLSVVLFAAAYVAERARALARWSGLLPPWRVLWPLALFVVLLVAALLVQRDLGMVLILALTLLALLGFGTGHPGYLVAGLLGAGAAGYLLLAVFSHGQRRVETWLDPFTDPTGGGWQVLQGLSGMYAGGLWGEGFAQGRPRYAPIAESDFIYAVLAEEFGFAGSLLLLACFGLLLWRLFVIAGAARSGFGMLLGTGIATVLSVQTLLNLGGVTKALPLTGLTLPLISHGGSSLLVVFASLGLALAISDGVPGGARAASAGRHTGVRKPRARGQAAPPTDEPKPPVRAPARPSRPRASAGQAPIAEPADRGSPAGAPRPRPKAATRKPRGDGRPPARGGRRPRKPD